MKSIGIFACGFILTQTTGSPMSRSAVDQQECAEVGPSEELVDLAKQHFHPREQKAFTAFFQNARCSQS
jgi:hypothetical protein